MRARHTSGGTSLRPLPPCAHPAAAVARHRLVSNRRRRLASTRTAQQSDTPQASLHSEVRRRFNTYILEVSRSFWTHCWTRHLRLEPRLCPATAARTSFSRTTSASRYSSSACRVTESTARPRTSVSYRRCLLSTAFPGQQEQELDRPDDELHLLRSQKYTASSTTAPLRMVTCKAPSAKRICSVPFPPSSWCPSPHLGTYPMSRYPQS